MTPLFRYNTLAFLVEEQVYNLGMQVFTSKQLRTLCRMSGTRLAKITDTQLDNTVQDTLHKLRVSQRLRREGKEYRCVAPVATTAVQQQAVLVHYGHEINRRAAVEQEIWNAVNGKTPMPDVEQLRKWALKLGVPECECFKEATT